jgi:hypothetical protein
MKIDSPKDELLGLQKLLKRAEVFTTLYMMLWHIISYCHRSTLLRQSEWSKLLKSAFLKRRMGVEESGLIDGHCNRKG